jgi:prepilin-type N-terminal cleavage/methylation domain-containing protein
VRKTDGLTLIELLIALTIFGILSSLVVSSLTGSFQLTRQSRVTLRATTHVQRAIEEVRGQWRVPHKYDHACVDVFELTPAPSEGIALRTRFIDLDSNANPRPGNQEKEVTNPRTCSDRASDVCESAMKRLTVVAVDAKQPEQVLAQAVLDINCPNRP